MCAFLFYPHLCPTPAPFPFLNIQNRVSGREGLSCIFAHQYIFRRRLELERTDLNVGTIMKAIQYSVIKYPSDHLSGFHCFFK